MASYKDFQSSPDDNNASPPVGAPEGGYKGSVINNTFRYVMAALRNLGDSVPKIPTGGNPETPVGGMAYQEPNSVNITGGAIAQSVIESSIGSLGTAATRDIGVNVGNVPELNASSQLARSTLPPMVGADGSTVGQSGAVPAPAAGVQYRYLDAYGTYTRPLLLWRENYRDTWATNTTYTTNHGFDRIFHLAFLQAQAKTNNNGFLSDETIYLYPAFENDGGALRGLAIKSTPNAISYHITTNSMKYINITDGSQFVISPSEWRIRIIGAHFNPDIF